MERDRASQLVSAVRLSRFTVGWNGGVGAASLVVSFIDPSLALAGFGFTALLDASASVVLVHRFRTEQRDPVGAERFERRAQAWVAAAMFLIASYVGVQAIRGLAGHAHPRAARPHRRVLAAAVTGAPMSFAG